MLCAQRFDVDGVGSQLSAVWLAAQAGHASTVAWLLQQGADGGAPGTDGRTPLHVACAAGHHETVRNLLASKGVSLSARAEGGRTPAHCAAEGGQLECLRLVLHEGRRRGKPAVADAMMDLADGHRCVLPFLPAPFSPHHLGARSVREMLDEWYYEAVRDGTGEAHAAERDFLIAWIGRQAEGQAYE